MDQIFINFNDDDFVQSDKKRRRLREKADAATEQRCNTLICVLENPSNMQNV